MSPPESFGGGDQESSGTTLSRVPTSRGATMAIVPETNLLHQAKKGQGETNQRLDALLVEMQKTNQLLERLLYALASAQAPQGRPRG